MTAINIVTPSETHKGFLGLFKRGSRLKFKFDRAAVQALLAPGDAIEIIITANLKNGVSINGSDFIKIIGEIKLAPLTSVSSNKSPITPTQTSIQNKKATSTPLNKGQKSKSGKSKSGSRGK